MLSDTSSRFTAAHRLTRQLGFDHVIRARNVFDEHFKVFFARNEGRNARLGIVASKKVFPGAVGRNRLKRRIREVFRHHSIRTSGLDLVVMARRAQAATAAQETRSLELLLGRIEDLCAKS